MALSKQALWDVMTLSCCGVQPTMQPMRAVSDEMYDIKNMLTSYECVWSCPTCYKELKRENMLEMMERTKELDAK